MSDTIRYAEVEGNYILKFEGDIRVTLCASFDAFIDSMFSNPKISNILLDLSQAKNIDSTALGMIAKIASQSIKILQKTPTTLSTNPDIDRILECMGLSQVLNMVRTLSIENPAIKNAKVKDMPLGDHTQAQMCEKVLEAHKLLMALNESNKAVFHDLVSGLEAERSEYCNELKH